MPFSILRARVGEASAIRLADLQRAVATRSSGPSDATRSAAANAHTQVWRQAREVAMHPRPQLTPDEHRSIRNWSFAMAIIYSFFMLAFFASVVVTTSRVAPNTNKAATGMQQNALRATQSADGRQPPAEASTQR
jgi:hypothetical protein